MRVLTRFQFQKNGIAGKDKPVLLQDGLGVPSTLSAKK